MRTDFPSISIVTASYSASLETLVECLKRVRMQDYPQEKIEIILGHGGSRQEIQAIARRFKAKYILIPRERQNAEYNRGVAFNKAKNELVLILDHDNFMPTTSFLREYIEPLLKHKEVVAVESCYYHYERTMPLMDRYFALFGVLDPVPFYFGKADRMMWTSKKWNLLGNAKDLGKYFLVEFDKNPRKIPTVGTNGCIMRRKIVLESADVTPEHHYPIDVMVEVILKGYTKFAFTKNSLIHMTGSRGFLSFLKRRLKFMKEYHFGDLEKRRYSVYMKGDFWKLIKFIVISVTLVKPTFDAAKGYLKIHDIVWFLHPFMCIGTLIVYGYGTLTSLVFKKYENTNS